MFNQQYYNGKFSLSYCDLSGETMGRAWHQTKDPVLVLQLFFWYAATCLVMPPDSISYKMLGLEPETIERKTHQVFEWLCNKYGISSEQPELFIDLINNQALTSEVAVLSSNYPRWKAVASDPNAALSMISFVSLMKKAAAGDPLLDQIEALTKTVNWLRNLSDNFVEYYKDDDPNQIVYLTQKFFEKFDGRLDD